MKQAMVVKSEGKAKQFTLGEHEVDLSNILPLKIRDWLAIKKLGVDITQITEASLGLDNIMLLVRYIVKKANPEVKENDILDLELPELVRIVTVATEVDAQIDPST